MRRIGDTSLCFADKRARVARHAASG
jgi:hypothetical protein